MAKQTTNEVKRAMIELQADLTDIGHPPNSGRAVDMCEMLTLLTFVLARVIQLEDKEETRR